MSDYSKHAWRFSGFIFLSFLTSSLPYFLTQARAAVPAAPPINPATGVELMELAVGERIQLRLSGIERLLVGDPALIDVQRPTPHSLEISGKSAGKTFLHVWTADGRHTRSVRVLPTRAAQAARARPSPQQLGHAKPMRLGYDVSYEMVRRGPNVERTDENTTTRIRHNLTSQMDTPYGQAAGRMEFRRLNAVQKLTTWRSSLTDGRLGPLTAFDAIAGDASVPFGAGSFAVPSTGYRGASVVSRALAPWRGSALWGRERFGALASSTAASSERDAFLSGYELAYDDPSGPWSGRAAAVFGYGEDRGPTESEYVADLINLWRITEPWAIRSELALSEEQFGYTLGSGWRSERFAADAVFRDIEADFHTTAGSTPDQGERGVRLSSRWNPSPAFSLRAVADGFRNRLFPNPAEPDTLNYDAEAGGSWRLRSGTTLSAHASRRSHLGFLSPSDDLNFGGGLSQRLPLQAVIPRSRRMLTLSALYEHADSRNVSNSALDFDAEVISLGASLPLGWGLTASVTDQLRLLSRPETFSDLSHHPRRLVASLTYGAGFGRGLWDLRGRVSYQDEANAGFLRSFLAGEDRLLGEAGLRFRPMPSLELFADGRVEHVETAPPTEHRLELLLFTGARVDWDTRVIRWDPAFSVAGAVFHDLNGDGARQSEEPGLPDVRVVAGMARQAVTDEAGEFRFERVYGTAVPVGVELSSLPQGYVVSTAPMQVVRPTQRAPWLEFGALGRAEIRGRVFYDLDGDGRYGGADRGVAGVRLQLDERWTKTDSSGWFFFRDLPGGRRTLSVSLESLPLQFLPTVPVRQQLDVREGEIRIVDVPVVVRRALQGRAYADANQSARWDRGDRPLPKLPVCLDGRRVAATDAQGVFRFEDLGLGRHTVVLNCGVPLEGWVPVSPVEAVLFVGWEDPELLTVDFRVLDKERLTKQILNDLSR